MAMINICTSTIICKIRCPVIFSDFFKSVADMLISHIFAIYSAYIISSVIYKLFYVKLKNKQCNTSVSIASSECDDVHWLRGQWTKII